MATQARHRRTGTASSAVASFQAATSKHPWPTVAVTPSADPQVHARELEVFHTLLAGRAFDDWRPSDLTVAARMACALVMLDNEYVLLNAEGAVLPIGGKTGTQPVRNPRLDAINALSSIVSTCNRALGLHGDPRDKRDLFRAQQAESKARGVIARAGRDPLLHDLLA